MKSYVDLFTGKDDKSYFKDVALEIASEEELGAYSSVMTTSNMRFRFFKAGAVYSWHNAPKPQYIIYLKGEVEVVSSGGERRVFTSGDVLFARDLTGEGHTTTTLTAGKSIVIEA